MKTASTYLIAGLLFALVSCESVQQPSTPETPLPEPETPEQEVPEAPETVVSKGAYKHVFIIGVDGGGAFFKDTDTPRCDEIFKDQATTYRSKTSFPTISAQCWGSILHGVLPDFHELDNDKIVNTPYPVNSPYPSIFRVAREAMPEAELASFVEWKPINTGIVEDGFNVTKGSGSDDADVTGNILAYLKNNTPTLMFVQFSAPDEIGEKHGFGTDLHLASISTIDALIGRIYDQIKLKDILDETLFIVTADHGGKGTTHGGDSEEERYVFLGVAGKTVCNGEITDGESRDVAAIAAYALGLECPETWTGHVPTGVFEDVIAGERKEMALPGTEYRNHKTEPTPDLSTTTALLEGHDVIAYLPFDGNNNDALKKITTSSQGSLSYSNAYYGMGVNLNNGYITLKDVKFGTKSFSVALWIKADPLTLTGADPSIISNKDWQEGVYSGFILSYRGSEDMKFNAGDGKKYRMDYTRNLPKNYDEGWMHVVLTVDRSKKKVRIYYDFAFDGAEADIPNELSDTAFDSMNLNIGQDGTGRLQYSLPAQMDELIITADVLSEDDIAAMKAHYDAE